MANHCWQEYERQVWLSQMPFLRGSSKLYAPPGSAWTGQCCTGSRGTGWSLLLGWDVELQTTNVSTYAHVAIFSKFQKLFRSFTNCTCRYKETCRLQHVPLSTMAAGQDKDWVNCQMCWRILSQGWCMIRQWWTHRGLSHRGEWTKLNGHIDCRIHF